ncbi:ankyrin repeat domain-containing protein [Paenibacillus ginsengarvi]|nr:ankyrin repeat domain-containing protein [Paenibacillus ginsengarvi]
MSFKKTIQLTFAAFLLIGVLGACSDGEQEAEVPLKDANALEEPADNTALRKEAEEAFKRTVHTNWDWNDLRVVRTDYGEYIACPSAIGPMIVYDADERKVYALNGQARGRLKLDIRDNFNLLDADYIKVCTRIVEKQESAPAAAKDRAALIAAIESGNPARVRQTLDKAYINEMDKAGKTPLHRALVIPPYKRHEIVDMLLAAGADPNVNGPDTIPAISLAAMKQDFVMFRKLMDAGADIRKGDWEDARPFIYAAANDARDIIDFLLQQGEDVNRPDSVGLYPVDHALITGQENMANYLRSLGGKSMLDQAKTKADAQKLLKQAKIEETQNFLELQVLFHNNIFVTKMMLKAGYPVNKAMNEALPNIAGLGRYEMVEALLEGGADPTIKVDGKTALEEARTAGHKDIVKLLQSFGADPNVKATRKPGMWLTAARSVPGSPAAAAETAAPPAKVQETTGTVPQADKPPQPNSPAPTVKPGNSAAEQPAAPDELPDGVLKPGAKGPGVKAVQETLLKLGESMPSGADGSYGKETTEALKSFQKKNELTADGIYGPSTKKAMQEQLKQSRSGSP